VDEQAIAALVGEVERAWNSHDMSRFAACFAEDADFVNVRGWWWRGRGRSSGTTPSSTRRSSVTAAWSWSARPTSAQSTMAAASLPSHNPHTPTGPPLPDAITTIFSPPMPVRLPYAELPEKLPLLAT
jgi:hypothetical protein